MKIDAHMHVDFNHFSAKDVILYLDKNKFDCCFLLTWEEFNPGPWHYEHLSIENVFETYLQYPDRIIPMYAPDPTRGDVQERFQKWHEKGIRGCAELKVALNWQSDEIHDLLSVVSKLKLPLLFHMEQSSTFFSPAKSDSALECLILKLLRTNRFFGLPQKVINIFFEHYEFLTNWKNKRTHIFPGYMLDFGSLGSVLNEYPNIKFIGHGPFFWKQISTNDLVDNSMYPNDAIRREGLLIDFLRLYPNLYADISAKSGFNALSRDRMFTKKFISEFSHKLIFGTDNTSLGHEDLLNSLNLEYSIRKQIFGENALHLLNN